MAVVYSHAHLNGGFGTEGFFALVRGQTGAGTLAVLGFFGISGFLVTKSFVNRERWLPFVRARALRIMPGFWFATLIIAFVLAPLCAALNAHSHDWSFSSAWSFVTHNALLRVGQWSIGDCLAGLPYPESLNGAQWSLFPEVCCYALVLLLGLAGVLRARRANLLVFTVSLVALHIVLVAGEPRPDLAPTLLSLTHLSPFVAGFFVGSTAYCYRAEFSFGRRPALFWGAFALILLKFGGWSILGPVVLPLAIVHAAHAFTLKLPVDLSYGIYILHFPILQVLAAADVQHRGFPAYFVASLLFTTLLATLSWYAVEKPALRLKGWRPRAIVDFSAPRFTAAP